MDRRDEVEIMALRYLRDHGPDQLGYIETEEQFAAFLFYADLKKAGLVESRSPGRGVVFWDITDAGITKLEGAQNG